MKTKRQVALLVISALLIGLLPMGNATVSKAAGYGLNNPGTDSDGLTTWNCVWFGNYWQEDTNGDGKADKNDAKQPIKWRVLSVNGDDAFLLADKNLDVQRYNDTYTDVTWETCTMRSWLNGYGAAANKEGKDYEGSNFLDYAFSSAEQAVIRTTNVVNDDNSYYGTEGGNDTSDKVYLLSLDEAMNPSYGFTSNTSSTKTRQAVNTSYVAGGGEINSGGMYSAGQTDVWWLRSPGNYCNFASGVNGSGYVSRNGDYVDTDFAVRPALHLNLSSTSSWSYAGNVASEGGEIGTATPEPSAQPTLSWDIPTEKPGVSPTDSPSAPPAATTKPGGESTMKPAATATVNPSAKPTTTPGAENPFVSSSPSQTLTPVLQPTTSPAAISVGKVASIKLTQKKQTVTASWKKVTGAAGYQIWYSTSKKWKGKKQKLLRKNKVTVKNLKKKKTYYFRVRAYQLDGTKKVYGAWSKTKKITMKK